MPTTPLTLTTVNRVGTAGVPQPAQQNSDVANGNSLPFNNGQIIIECQNTIAGARTVTVVTPGTVDSLAIADYVATLPNSSFNMIGPFPPGIYNATDGTVTVTASGSAGDVKFRCYLLGN